MLQIDWEIRFNVAPDDTRARRDNASLLREALDIPGDGVFFLSLSIRLCSDVSGERRRFNETLKRNPNKKIYGNQELADETCSVTDWSSDEPSLRPPRGTTRYATMESMKAILVDACRIVG